MSEIRRILMAIWAKDELGYLLDRWFLSRSLSLFFYACLQWAASTCITNHSLWQSHRICMRLSVAGLCCLISNTYHVLEVNQCCALVLVPSAMITIDELWIARLKSSTPFEWHDVSMFVQHGFPSKSNQSINWRFFPDCIIYEAYNYNLRKSHANVRWTHWIFVDIVHNKSNFKWITQIILSNILTKRLAYFKWKFIEKWKFNEKWNESISKQTNAVGLHTKNILMM